MKKVHERASYQKAPANIDNVINKIRVVKTKSRASLLEEDIKLLDDCEEELLQLKEKPPCPDCNNYEDVGRIVLLIVKFLLNDFQVD